MKRPSERKKTTLTIHESVLADFIQVCKQIGLRRDTYLNHVLPRAISLFESSRKKNSPEAKTITKLLHREKGGLKKFCVVLDRAVLKDLNTLCVKKSIPRDIFFEEVLKYLVHTLNCSALHDPWSNFSDEGSSPFDHIFIGEVSMKEALAVLEKEL